MADVRVGNSSPPETDVKAAQGATLISVVIPTYKRPDLLRRAVESVLAQTYPIWELLVSDDEDPPGAAAEYLASLDDRRIRAVRNPGPHGQAGNINFALRHARGTWIKPLFDDDMLLPHCLEVMLRSVEAAQSAGGDPVLASCGIIEYRDGQVVRPGVDEGPLLLLVPRRLSPLFSLEGQPVAGGAPTQLFVHRRALDAGIFFEQPTPLVSGVDQYWVMRVRMLGDNLIVNLPLAEFHQGAHSTVTSGITDEALDRELEFLIAKEYALIESSVRRSSLAHYQQVTRVVRALHRLKQRKLGEASRLAATCWRPSAWLRGVSIASKRRLHRLVPLPEHRVLDDAKVREILGVRAPLS